LQKAEKYQTELTQAEESMSNPEEDEQANKAKIQELVKEAQEQADLRQELHKELKEGTVPLKQIERQLAQLNKQQKAAAKQLKAARQRLQEARDQIIANADSAESEEARRTALLKQTEEELGAARANVDELKQRQTNMLRKYEEIEPHVQDATSKINGIKSQLSSISNTLRTLSSSTGDSLAILGPRVSKVAQLVSILC